MINPAWLVQLVGLRIVDKGANPKRSDLEVISELAEEGISHIEASIPRQRMISKRSINAWAKERRTLLLRHRRYSYERFRQLVSQHVDDTGGQTAGPATRR